MCPSPVQSSHCRLRPVIQEQSKRVTDTNCRKSHWISVNLTSELWPVPLMTTQCKKKRKTECPHLQYNKLPPLVLYLFITIVKLLPRSNFLVLRLLLPPLFNATSSATTPFNYRKLHFIHLLLQSKWFLKCVFFSWPCITSLSPLFSCHKLENISAIRRHLKGNYYNLSTRSAEAVMSRNWVAIELNWGIKGAGE